MRDFYASAWPLHSIVALSCSVSAPWRLTRDASVPADIRMCGTPGLAPLLPLFGPELCFVDQLFSNYQWPQWHQQHMASGALVDGCLLEDPGTWIKLLLLDTARAEAVAEAQLQLFTRVLVSNGGESGNVMLSVSLSMSRFHVQWPTPPPGHAEVSALMKQLARDKHGGFANLDLVTLNTLEEQMRSFCASGLKTPKNMAVSPCSRSCT